MNKNAPSVRPTAIAVQVARALSVLCLTSPLVSYAQAQVNLEPVVVSGKADDVLDATRTAPSQGSVTARTAQSSVSDAYIRNFISPVADYTQILTMTPGVFSYTPNGVGLGDAKITLRGLSDSNTVFSFDGIPFNDTNGVSHHSWVFFPSQFIGGAVVDRSPGTAATIGQATFGGSIDLQSRVLGAERRASVTASTGTWSTHLLGAEYETGAFGTDGTSKLLFNVHEMRSDGYQTYNDQVRKATSIKYQTALTDNTTLTAFGSFLNLKNNTPNIKGLSRTNYLAGNYTYLLSGDPLRADYFGYNFYNITTDFGYVGFASNLGAGWKLEDKIYSYKYHNKQNYNGATLSAASAINTVAGATATDKLNSYQTKGNVLRVTNDSSLGTLRTGVWLDHANSYRYQTPADPRTWVDLATPNFSETYLTKTLQPYVEFEFKITEDLKATPGVKYASYKQGFVHLQDNGKGVGPLGGTYSKSTGKITGGAPSLSNDISYSDVMPSFDVHYTLKPNWSTYAQYSVGDQIQDTGVFDVPNAKPLTVPKTTKAKTAQFGTVWNADRIAFSADAYHTKLDSAYTKVGPDASGNYSWIFSGTETNQGVEAELNVAIGYGFSVYSNATFGSLKYDSTKLWVAGAPRDTESLGLNYEQGCVALGVSANRVGKMYNDGTDTAGKNVNQAFTIDPVVLTNVFANYTIRHLSTFAKQAKFQLSVNNLFNRHSIVGVASSLGGSSSAKPNSADLLTILPARSVNFTATLDF